MPKLCRRADRTVITRVSRLCGALLGGTAYRGGSDAGQRPPAASLCKGSARGAGRACGATASAPLFGLANEAAWAMRRAPKARRRPCGRHVARRPDCPNCWTDGKPCGAVRPVVRRCSCLLLSVDSVSDAKVHRVAAADLDGSGNKFIAPAYKCASIHGIQPRRLREDAGKVVDKGTDPRHQLAFRQIDGMDQLSSRAW